MVVAFHPAIHNRRIPLFSDPFFGYFMIDPVGVTPHHWVDLTKFNGRTGVVGDSISEVIVEVSIVQEHVGVVPEAVEVSLNRFDRLYNTVKFLVSGEDDESGVGSGALGIDFKTARREDFVMLLADFPVLCRDEGQLPPIGGIKMPIRKAVGLLTNLIDGGVPAGIKMEPGAEGWVTMRKTIRTITMHGNNKTKPRGIETEEFLLSLIRRRKNANLGITTPFSLNALSREERCGRLGTRFASRCARPMRATMLLRQQLTRK